MGYTDVKIVNDDQSFGNKQRHMRDVMFDHTSTHRLNGGSCSGDQPFFLNNSLFSALTDLLPAAVFITDGEGRIVFLNQKGLALFGTIPDSPELFFIPDGRNQIKKILAEGAGEPLEFTALKKDGGSFPALIHVRRLTADGSFTGMAGVIQDISHQQCMKKELLKAEQKCLDIFQNTWEFWILCDFEGNLLESSITQSLTYNGDYTISESDLVGLNIMDFLSDDLKHVMQRNFREVREKGVTRGVEHVLLKDGNEYSYEYNQVLVYEGNTPVAIRILTRDVTEEFKAKKALEISEARYRGVFENTGQPTVILEADRVISMVNARFEALTGFCKDDIEGKMTLFRLVSHSDGEERLRRFLDRPGESAWELECRLTGLNGETFDMIMQVGNMALSNQKVLSFTDITSRKKAEAHLVESRDHLQNENRLLRSSMKERFRFGNIIGKCRVMQDLYAAIVNAAETSANVVLYGESGTGKELVAREIHAMSARKDRRFVAVNCGAIPENIIESEFFGYKKGAFTGAYADKPGFLNYADGGTLFLDEVGEINLTMQVKLLRVIDNGEYTPLGSNAGRTTDIRIIAATHRNLRDLVRDGLIREDFFYRIHIIPIELPSLRERKEDIPLLIDHFMTLHGGAETSASRIQMDRFLDHDWPGNVRELQNVVHRFISMKKLDFGGASAKQNEFKTPEPTEGMNLAAMLDACEKKILQKTLDECRWRRGKAAKALGINRKTLFTKIVKHGLGDS